MTDLVLAIDPGDVHVGWASAMLYGSKPEDWEVETGEWTPAECSFATRRILTLYRVPELVIEEFRLYPGEAVEQHGSDFKTSQLIGALKLIAHDHGVPVIMQGATIKKPTRRQLKARGIEQAKGSVHAKDAELHLYYRLLRNQGAGTMESGR